MSLSNCPQCHKIIRQSSSSCPHCQALIPTSSSQTTLSKNQNKRKKKQTHVSLYLFFGGLIYYAMSSSSAPDSQPSTIETLVIAFTVLFSSVWYLTVKLRKLIKIHLSKKWLINKLIQFKQSLTKGKIGNAVPVLSA